MTLSEAIIYCQDIAYQEDQYSEFETDCETYAMSDIEREEHKKKADMYRQFEEWFRDLKEYQKTLVVSEHVNTRVNYFIKDPYEHNIITKLDGDTHLPTIVIDGKPAFQMLIADKCSKGQRCNVAICHENVDKEVIANVIAPMVLGEVPVIQIKEKR